MIAASVISYGGADDRTPSKKRGKEKPLVLNQILMLPMAPMHAMTLCQQIGSQDPLVPDLRAICCCFGQKVKIRRF